MANVKSAGVREIVLDRCLRQHRGYTIKELLEKVNKQLLFERLPPVTSENTIRNDLDNISNRWKITIEKGKRRQAVTYSYSDPSFSIYNSQLTDNELRRLHTLLGTVREMDVFRGCPSYVELHESLSGILQLNFYQVPIMLYENVMSEQEERHIVALYNAINDWQTVSVEHCAGKVVSTVTIHPYFLREKERQWYLLGMDAKSRMAVCIPTNRIISISNSSVYNYEHYSANDVEKYCDLLHKVS